MTIWNSCRKYSVSSQVMSQSWTTVVDQSMIFASIAKYPRPERHIGLFDNSVFTSDEQESLFHACIELVGRTGAEECEFGYQNDDVPVAEADWFAYAKYKGGVRVTVEHHLHPADAMFALAVRLLTGAQCQHCKKVVTLTPGEYFAYIKSTLLTGEEWNIETTAERGSCLWAFDGERFERGCINSN